MLAPSATGIVSITVEDGTRSWFDLDYRRVPDLLPMGERVATLQQLAGGRTEVLIAESDGSEIATLELPGGARRLLAANDLLLVMVDAEGRECEQADGSACDQRNVTVIDPAEEPALIGSVDLPSPELACERLERNWLDPIETANGDWIFIATESVSCIWIDECDELGIAYVPLSEANVAFGSPADCPPDAPSCPEPPPPPQVYGTRTRQELYRLALTDPANPKLEFLGASELELPDSRLGPVRVFARRVSPAWQTLNIPGYPVGFDEQDGASRLYSVEPIAGSEKAATFYRLRIEADGAHVEASRELSGRYGDLRVAGGRAYYVRQGTDGCSSGQLQPIALDGELPLLDAIELPGTQWEVLDQRGDQLLLRGPNYRGLALFDLDAAGPVLRGYFTGTVLGDSARLHDGEIWSAADSYGVVHIVP